MIPCTQQIIANFVDQIIPSMSNLLYETPTIEVLELRVEGFVCASDTEESASFDDPNAILDDLTTIIWW
jgi:hypothetical protein